MSLGPIIIGIDPARAGADATVTMRMLDDRAVEVIYIVDGGATAVTSDRILDLILAPGATNYPLTDLRGALHEAKLCLEDRQPSAEPLPPYRGPVMHVMHISLHKYARPRPQHAAARRDRRRRRRTMWLAELRA